MSKFGNVPMSEQLVINKSKADKCKIFFIVDFPLFQNYKTI